MVPAKAREASVADHVEPRRASDPFVIVIDPAMGNDRGATGEKGTEEKAVNLAFGLALRSTRSRLIRISKC